MVELVTPCVSAPARGGLGVTLAVAGLKCSCLELVLVSQVCADSFEAPSDRRSDTLFFSVNMSLVLSFARAHPRAVISCQCACLQHCSCNSIDTLRAPSNVRFPYVTYLVDVFDRARASRCTMGWRQRGADGWRIQCHWLKYHATRRNSSLTSKLGIVPRQKLVPRWQAVR